MTARISAIIGDDWRGTQSAERDGCLTAAIYGDLEQEYTCVRERVGLQDLSHYGKIKVSGDAALDLINHLILTDLARLAINQLQASFMLDADGRPVCDLMVANLGTHYLLLTEGAAPADVLARLTEAAADFPGAVVTDQSDAIALVSVDGPYAWELLKTFFGLGIIGTRYLEIVPKQSIAGIEVTMCRAGKTGEYGYLLMAAAEQTLPLWAALKTAGERFGLLPIGTKAVDLCKMENRTISRHREGAAVDNVLELNTRTMFGRDKDDHVGRAALEAVMEKGVARRIVGMSFPDSEQEQDGISVGADINFGSQPVGSLVNAGYSFTLKRWIGLALIKEEFACVGVEYGVKTPSGTLPAHTVSAPFLFNKSLTIRPQEDSFFT